MDTISKPDEPMHVESMTIYGFDTRTKKYTMFGIDTIGTYSVSAMGDYDGERKTMVLKGENEEPGVGKMPFEWNVRFDGADKWVQEIWFDMPTGKTKIVTLTAVRGK